MGLNFYQLDRATGLFIKKMAPVDITANRHRDQMYVDPNREKAVRPIEHESSKYIGVIYRNKCNRPWQARIKIEGASIVIGYFLTEREAAIAYDNQAIKLGRKTNILKKAS